MALTISRHPTPEQFIRFGRGNVVAFACKVTFDNSYPTGGEAIAASDFGLSTIAFVAVNAQSGVVTKFVRWDSANSKLLIYIEDGTSGISAEAANASDQSAVTVDLLVIGTVGASF